ncbi:hypothetical protein MMC21_001987 [Puttea exsequens]|nr:hypothetical protein [Puttea exsequens]
MRILLLGASGRTGGLALTEALTRNHTVTALVRRPESLSPQSNLSIIKGTPLSKDDIANAFTSAPSSDPVNAVVSTLNTGRTSDNPWAKMTAPADFMAQSISNTLAVMREHKAKKIVVLGTVGVGSSRQNSGFIFKFVVDHSNLKVTFDDHYEVEKLLRAEAEKDAQFEWVDIRATGLSDGKAKDIKEFGNEGKGIGMFISRESASKFILDAVESNRWDGQTPAISN